MKNMINQKGQAFDVFKLLIAAVVAGSILLILLQVLGGTIFLNEKEPNEEAIKIIKSATNRVSSPQTVKDITFKEGSTLSSKTIENQDLGLSEDQVCILVSNKIPNFDKFTKTIQGKLVEYTGRNAQKTKLLSICDRGSELGETIEELGYESSDRYDFDMGDCAQDFEDGSSTACLIAIIPNS